MTIMDYRLSEIRPDLWPHAQNNPGKIVHYKLASLQNQRKLPEMEYKEYTQKFRIDMDFLPLGTDKTHHRH